MKIAIIGGKLQGTEAVYLAKKAGFETILIDRDAQVPASGLADRFVCGDAVRRDAQVIAAMKEADFILPCNENDALLDAICQICEEEGLRLAFDPEAYSVTKSKAASDALMHENDIPSPRYYPQGQPPYIIKPSGESGSAGVRRIESREEAAAFLAECRHPEEWIVQEYLEGPSYSVEVIGVPGNYRTYAVTQIHMDQVYDCCRVTAPYFVGEPKERRISEIAQRLAELVGLHGIMDVEVIDDGEDMKVLEIDARLPSQTPIAVLTCSGMNYVRELADIFCAGEFRSKQAVPQGFSVYEHYRRVSGEDGQEDGQTDRTEILQEGEHMMAEVGPLSLLTDFCGCQEVMTDYSGDAGPFRGIFISWDETREGLEQRRQAVLENLKLLP